MPKWKIIIPVLIVIVVGLVAYLQMTNKEEVGPIVPAGDEAVAELGGEMDVTGEEDVDVQVDALIDSLLDEAAMEETDAGDGSDVVSALEEGEDETELFTVETYE
ncbi:MAG: hypothetical protein U9Q03_06255 [Patescibacteria group bacterium]|nr:hypothetical protein [Patescibacteria group bacterium]